MNSTEWKSKGKLIDIFGRKIFVISSEIDISKETMVILHGYPTSSYDYHKVLPQLSEKYNVVIHDHLGFGFSDKPLNYSYSLIEQTNVALLLWKALKINNLIILAHDYGTSIATEILARNNQNQLQIKIKEMILCNGSMHIELSQLRPIQKLLSNKITGKWVAKLSNFHIFRKNIRNIFFDKHKANEEDLKEMWLQLEHNGGRNVIHLLSNYINERYFFWHRWIGALKTTKIPIKIIWAKEDPVAVKEIAELLATEIPNNSLNWIENCGHFPMLESHEKWTELVLK